MNDALLDEGNLCGATLLRLARILGATAHLSKNAHLCGLSKIWFEHFAMIQWRRLSSSRTRERVRRSESMSIRKLRGEARPRSSLCLKCHEFVCARRKRLRGRDVFPDRARLMSAGRAWRARSELARFDRREPLAPRSLSLETHKVPRDRCQRDSFFLSSDVSRACV